MYSIFVFRFHHADPSPRSAAVLDAAPSKKASSGRSKARTRRIKEKGGGSRGAARAGSQTTRWTELTDPDDIV